MRELTESTKEQVESLTKSIGALEKVAAIEEARAEEAKRGTAKGRDHELDVETLLGALIAVTGDGLDDVSNVIGLDGSKKGDKVVYVRGGMPIVTEEKCTQPNHRSQGSCPTQRSDAQPRRRHRHADRRS